MRRVAFLVVGLAFLAPVGAEDAEVRIERLNGSVVELDGTPAPGARVALYAERAGLPAAEDELEPRACEAIAAAVSSFEPPVRELACRALAAGHRLELVTAALVSASEFELAVPRPLGRSPAELVSLLVVASAGEGETFRADTVAVDLATDASKKRVEVAPLKLVPGSRITFTVRAAGAPACSASVVVRSALPNLCCDGRRTRPQPSKRWSIALDHVSDDFEAQLHVTVATTTDAEGRATLYLAPDRWCELRVAFPGYATVRDQLCTSADQPAHEEIDLEPDGRIGGRALDPDGKPLASVPVEAYDGRPGDFHLAAVATTDATGAFELADLASEQCYLLVVRGGDGLADLRASVAAPAVGVELVPERACSLDVRVTYPADRPAETLQLVLDRTDVPREGVAWATYHYAPNPVPVARFTGLLPGTYRVRCHSEFRFAPQITDEVAVVASETRAVALAVRQARSVRGTVKDEAGKPLRASYRVAVPGFFTTCGRSSSNGSFEIPGLPWFDVDVWVSADGYEAKVVSLGSDLTTLPDVVLAKQQP